VLGVLCALLGFIYWMKNDASGGEGKNYYVLFDGSARGLTEASPVLFNGIRYGAVRSVELLPSDSRKVRVLISVRADTPVRDDSVARISQQGLAGFIALEITPGTPEAGLLAAKPGETYPTIMAETAAGGLFAGIGDAATSAKDLLARLNNVVAANESALQRTLANVEAFTGMLNERKDDVAAVIKDARTLSGKLNELSAKLDAAVDKIAGTGPNDDASVVAQAQQAVNSFRQLADKLDHSLGDHAGGITQQAERSLKEFELFMKDGRRLADSLDRVVQKLDRNPSGFLLGGQQSPKY
jgi:phospholipid/cholesterol/gamma-HCH transport system substrate-binding protein